MSSVGTCGWRIVSVTDTAPHALTVVVSAPGPQGPAGPGGGTLSALADVHAEDVADGDVLSFDSARAAWTSSRRDRLTDGGNF